MDAKFTIPYPKERKKMSAFCKRFGLNAYWAGKHWAKRKEDAEEIHSLVKTELMQQKIPRVLFKKPVSIAFYWNDHLDNDNHAALVKMIIDGMKDYLLQDDDRRFVKATHNYFYDEPYITVELTEI